MGYTHYWRRPVRKDHGFATWNTFVDECRKLYKNMPDHSESSGAYYKDYPLALGGCFTFEHPQFTEDKILFNGSNGNKRKNIGINDNIEWEDTGYPEDLGHETFALTRTCPKQHEYSKNEPMYFDFCKTARKPYDLMVQACLLLYRHFFSDVVLSSDGDEADWKEARVFVAKVTGIKIIGGIE